MYVMPFWETHALTDALNKSLHQMASIISNKNISPIQCTVKHATLLRPDQLWSSGRIEKLKT